MQAAATFEATPRETAGKGAARALRREGRIPAVIYGEGKPTVSLALKANELNREYYHGGFFSKVVEIKNGKDSFFALPKDIQVHPVNDHILHVDFLQVTEKSTITVLVPVHFRGMEKCVGIKRGGNLNIVRHDLELTCSVNNIPRSIDIDISKMNIGDSLHISAVDLPDGVTPAITDRDFTIATVAGRGGKQDKEDAAESTEEAEGAEGEAKAEGDAKDEAKE